MHCLTYGTYYCLFLCECLVTRLCIKTKNYLLRIERLMCMYPVISVFTCTKRVGTEDVIQNVFCLFCYRVSKTTKLINKTYYTFLSIPIFPKKTSKAYIGCNRCLCGFGARHMTVCDKCRCIIVNKNRFCGRCGSRKT